MATGPGGGINHGFDIMLGHIMLVINFFVDFGTAIDIL